jgi:hypothetical protein
MRWSGPSSTHVTRVHYGIDSLRNSVRLALACLARWRLSAASGRTTGARRCDTTLCGMTRCRTGCGLMVTRWSRSCRRSLSGRRRGGVVEQSSAANVWRSTRNCSHRGLAPGSDFAASELLWAGIHSPLGSVRLRLGARRRVLPGTAGPRTNRRILYAPLVNRLAIMRLWHG